MNQLFSCSRIFNQSIATTTRDRREKKHSAVTGVLILHNRLKQKIMLEFDLVATLMTSLTSEVGSFSEKRSFQGIYAWCCEAGFVGTSDYKD